MWDVHITFGSLSLRRTKQTISCRDIEGTFYESSLNQQRQIERRQYLLSQACKDEQRKIVELNRWRDMEQIFRESSLISTTQNDNGA